MATPSADWEQRIAEVWSRLDDDTDPDAFRDQVDALAAELD